MISLSLKDMLAAGAHFGHQTRRWNPKMRDYLYGERAGVHIIDLSKTLSLFRRALEFVIEIVANGEDILFVGTKKQIQDIVEAKAKTTGIHYVNSRWMGGTLTNFSTIKASIDRLIAMEEARDKGDHSAFTKRERLGIDRKIAKLSASLGGIRNMKGLPGALVIIDPKCERIAVHEAKVLEIPIAALVDTNCDPDVVDYVVPGNDDAVRSVEYFLEKVAEAVAIGMGLRDERVRKTADLERTRAAEGRDDSKASAAVHEGTEARAYVRKGALEEPAAVSEAASGTYSASAETEVVVGESGAAKETVQ